MQLLYYTCPFIYFEIKESWKHIIIEEKIKENFGNLFVSIKSSIQGNVDIKKPITEKLVLYTNDNKLEINIL